MATPPKKRRVHGTDVPSPVGSGKRRRCKLAHLSVALYVEWGPISPASSSSCSPLSRNPLHGKQEDHEKGPGTEKSIQKPGDPKGAGTEKSMDKPGDLRKGPDR